MRFIDEATILVKAGHGGHGCVSFLREKFKPRGGPNGGNGGKGGSVYLAADPSLLSLYDFRLKRIYQASNGQPGQGSQCDGAKGEDLLLRLPVGTQVFRIEEDGEQVLCDLTEPHKEVLVAQGGRGGKGNAFFKTATNRAPHFAQRGEQGESRTLRLELKILADVGLLGLPNAGKSTFLSRVSEARPKIAPYPFTTLEPQLGVLTNPENQDQRIVLADIPGLVEGAHRGLGLGHRFLKHVERTRFLIHILSFEDINQDDPWAGFALLNSELAAFNPELATRTQIEVVNKMDLASPSEFTRLKECAHKDGRKIFFLSAKEGLGIDEVLKEMWVHYQTLTPASPRLHSLFSATERSEHNLSEPDVAFEYHDA